MSTLKIHVVKGVNSYTDDLIKTEQRSINRRREVNFNIGDLNAHQRSSSRTKSFALYKRSHKKRRKSVSTEKEEDKEMAAYKEEERGDETPKDEETTSGILKKDYEPETKEQQDGQPDVVDEVDDLDKKGIQPDLISIIKESNDAASPKGHGSDTDDDPSGGHTDDEGNNDADSSKQDNQSEVTDKDTVDDNKTDNTDDIGAFSFFSVKDGDNVSVSPSEDKDIAAKFKKFTEKIKENYNKSSFKEMHDRNMENMRKQFKGLVGKKRDDDSDSDATDYSEGSQVDYWGTPGDAGFSGTATTPGGFRFNQSRFSSNPLMNKKNPKDLKRCCC